MMTTLLVFCDALAGLPIREAMHPPKSPYFGLGGGRRERPRRYLCIRHGPRRDVPDL